MVLTDIILIKNITSNTDPKIPTNVALKKLTKCLYRFIKNPVAMEINTLFGFYGKNLNSPLTFFCLWRRFFSVNFTIVLYAIIAD